MKDRLSTDDLINMILDAIIEEPFFRRDVLRPKIKVIVRDFKLHLDSANYNSIESPNKTAKLIKAIEREKIEKEFFRLKTKSLVSDIEMKEFYKELDKKRN